MREMKDSGIEWIGEIPKDWKIGCIKNIIEVLTDYTANGSFADLAKNVHYLNNDGFARLVRLTDLRLDLSNDDGVYVSEKSYNYLAKSSLFGGEILVANVGAYAGLFCEMPQKEGRFTLGPNMFLLRTNKRMIQHYLYYLGQTKCVKEQLAQKAISSAQPKLNKTDLKTVFIVIPSIVEQQHIVDFLTSKCSEIDATAEDIQKEITLLEDYKKSLVYNVISNGINHSIYSTESDEVWGNLPQGWKLVDIKYLFEIVKRIAGKEGYDVLSVTQKGLKIKDITSGDGQLADNYSGYQFVYPTDYVMNHMDLLTGWVDCSELFGVTSPDYRVFRLMDKAANNLVYYKYVMQCCYMNKIFYSLGQGVSNLGRWRLQTSSFNNFKVPVPTKAEQDEIADFLDTKCSEIDSLIADKKRQLDILADYKKSLIYEYVTGKKEVPVNE